MCREEQERDERPPLMSIQVVVVTFYIAEVINSGPLRRSSPWTERQEISHNFYLGNKLSLWKNTPSKSPACKVLMKKFNCFKSTSTSTWENTCYIFCLHYPEYSQSISLFINNWLMKWFAGPSMVSCLPLPPQVATVTFNKAIKLNKCDFGLVRHQPDPMWKPVCTTWPIKKYICKIRIGLKWNVSIPYCSLFLSHTQES